MKLERTRGEYAKIKIATMPGIKLPKVQRKSKRAAIEKRNAGFGVLNKVLKSRFNKKTDEEEEK